MFRMIQPTAIKVTFLALLTLAFASAASASSCMSQGETIFQNCIESMAADGTVTAWEEGVCSSLTADVVTECELVNKPNFQPLVSCSKNWSFVIFWDDYPGEFTVLIVWSGTLSCS